MSTEAEMHTWNLVDLDVKTRGHMIAEFESDVQDDSFYKSRNFAEYGITQYPKIMRYALEFDDPNKLIKQLDTNFFKDHRDGRRVEKNAAEKFGGGQFNHYYIRGLCLRAIDEDIPNLVVYRAKCSSIPRFESDAMIDEMRNASELLADLRAHKDSPPSLGFPPGPNSGLSVRLP